MLDLRRLRTFREVVRRSSFSAAASALGYTQSSVSQQISTLERELGLTLIERAGRPTGPTAAGAALLERAEALLSLAASIERELADMARGERGVLRLGGFFTAWATFVPTAVATFARSHPAVQLELAQLEPEAAVRAVRAGELDVAVVYRFSAPADEDLDGGRLAWAHLLDDPYAVALPAGHRLAPRQRVRLRELAAERWVAPPRGDPYTDVLAGLCREHGGFEPDIAYETGDIAMAQPLVAAGLAVAMLPALGLVPTHAGVVARPLASTPPARSLWAVSRADRRPAAPVAMTDALRRAASLPYRRSPPMPARRRIGQTR